MCFLVSLFFYTHCIYLSERNYFTQCLFIIEWFYYRFANTKKVACENCEKTHTNRNIKLDQISQNVLDQPSNRFSYPYKKKDHRTRTVCTKIYYDEYRQYSVAGVAQYSTVNPIHSCF